MKRILMVCLVLISISANTADWKITHKTGPMCDYMLRYLKALPGEKYIGGEDMPLLKEFPKIKYPPFEPIKDVEALKPLFIQYFDTEVQYANNNFMRGQNKPSSIDGKQDVLLQWFYDGVRSGEIKVYSAKLDVDRDGVKEDMIWWRPSWEAIQKKSKIYNPLRKTRSLRKESWEFRTTFHYFLVKKSEGEIEESYFFSAPDSYPFIYEGALYFSGWGGADATSYAYTIWEGYFNNVANDFRSKQGCGYQYLP
jgi:hypothetical protein